MLKTSVTQNRIRVGRPPIPHEHGAWVMLYAPLLIGFAVAGIAAPAPWLLLTLAASGAFLAREAAGLLMRRRGKPGTAFWLALYALITSGAGLPLLAVYRAVGLIPIGLLALALFAVHSALLLIPFRKRLDRSQWGEILGAAGLTLTGPAAWAVARGTLAWPALALWLACALYFSSGILFVKMWLAAVTCRGDWTPDAKRRVARANAAYHLLLAVLVAGAAIRLGGAAGLLLAVAFLPAIARGLWGAATLTNELPPLKRVGALETFYSLWFVIFFTVALRRLVH